MNRWIYQASNALHSIIHRSHVNVNTQRDLKIFSLFTLWENAYMFVECFFSLFQKFHAMQLWNVFGFNSVERSVYAKCEHVVLQVNPIVKCIGFRLDSGLIRLWKTNGSLFCTCRKREMATLKTNISLFLHLQKKRDVCYNKWPLWRHPKSSVLPEP